MASPQTHGLITLLILFVFSLFGKITSWEYLTAIFWGILIDIDHFTSLSYIKDLKRRIKEKGGLPANNVKFSREWLHKWPGLLAAFGCGATLSLIMNDFRFYLPVIVLITHLIVDYFQGIPYHLRQSFWYPFRKTATVPSEKFLYPVKPPREFIITSGLWMLASLILLGILIR